MPLKKKLAYPSEIVSEEIEGEEAILTILQVLGQSR